MKRIVVGLVFAGIFAAPQGGQAVTGAGLSASGVLETHRSAAASRSFFGGASKVLLWVLGGGFIGGAVAMPMGNASAPTGAPTGAPTRLDRIHCQGGTLGASFRWDWRDSWWNDDDDDFYSGQHREWAAETANTQLRCRDEHGTSIVCQYRANRGRSNDGDPQTMERSCTNGARIYGGEIDFDYYRGRPTRALLRNWKIRTSDGVEHNSGHVDGHLFWNGPTGSVDYNSFDLVAGRDDGRRRKCFDGDAAYVRARFPANIGVTKISLAELYRYALKNRDNFQVEVESGDGSFEPLLGFKRAEFVADDQDGLPSISIILDRGADAENFEMQYSYAHLHDHVRIAGQDQAISMTSAQLRDAWESEEEILMETRGGWRRVVMVSEGVSRSLIQPNTKSGTVCVYANDDLEDSDCGISTTWCGNPGPMTKALITWFHQFYIGTDNLQEKKTENGAFASFLTNLGYYVRATDAER